METRELLMPAVKKMSGLIAISDAPRARKLMRRLHFCSRWYGQAEIDRLQSMKIGN